MNVPLSSYYMPLQFSGVDQLDFDGRKFEQTKAKYLWDVGRKNTNLALREGTEIMKSVGMDADGLNRDCAITVDVPMPEGKYGRHFIPDCWIHWKISGKTIAYLEFVEPTKGIEQLHVYNEKYNLRKPLVITNLLELMIEGHAPKSLLKRLNLDVTNTPAMTNAPK